MLTNEITHEAFVYTHDFDGDSSFVRHVWYDENNAELLVGLDPNTWGDDYTEYYLYSDVDQSVYDAFRSSGSRGRFYNQNVKHHYSSVHLAEKPEIRLFQSSNAFADTRGQQVPVPGLRTYEVRWSWNGQSMPAHVVETVSENAAIEALTDAVKALGLTGAKVTGIRFVTTVDRPMDLDIT